MQFGGSNLYVSYGSFDDSATSGVTDTDQNRLNVMYGIYLDSDWELFGRYTDSDGSSAATLDGSVVTIGVNNYLSGQNAKWTTEVLLNNSATGANTDVATFATQLQFYF